MNKYDSSKAVLAKAMQNHLVNPVLVPEQDTLERALWRVDTVLAGFYDGETEEPVQALGDLMTDILHWCDYHERSLSSAEDRATQMVEWERADWGLPRIWSSDRMFRKTGPLVRQKRSER